MSMLSVDYRQMQQRLQKLEGEHRQESEKVHHSANWSTNDSLSILRFFSLQEINDLLIFVVNTIIYDDEKLHTYSDKELT